MPATCANNSHTTAEKTASASLEPSTVPLPRLSLAWAVMFGGMVAFWFIRPYLTPPVWTNCTAGVLFVTSKFATFVCMPPKDRRRLSWGRSVGYLFWLGMQPRQFLPEYTPDKNQPAPDHSRTAAQRIDGRRVLVDSPQPDASRKLWHCPLAATSLVDFWGQRWNRIFSGMLREVMFRPLARRLGAGLALFAVFLYSGLLHENFSVAAWSGYGLPLSYFVIQGLGTWLESRRALRRIFQRRPWLGRAWTTAIVLGPVTLLLHEGYREQVCVPMLAGLGVPGLEQRQP